MIEIGRLAVKLAGRDAGKKCVIVDIIDNNYVLIDGETRRRKCNVAHLEILKDVVKINKGASHNTIKDVLAKAGIKVFESKPKPKTEKPKKVRRKKVKVEEEKKVKKKGKEKVKKEKKVVETKVKEEKVEEKK